MTWIFHSFHRKRPRPISDDKTEILIVSFETQPLLNTNHDGQQQRCFCLTVWRSKLEDRRLHLFMVSLSGWRAPPVPPHTQTQTPEIYILFPQRVHFLSAVLWLTVSWEISWHPCREQQQQQPLVGFMNNIQQ